MRCDLAYSLQVKIKMHYAKHKSPVFYAWITCSVDCQNDGKCPLGLHLKRSPTRIAFFKATLFADPRQFCFKP